jgi:fructose-1,6-bisphosphatase/inositol monophosphatase family enzyme
MELTDVHIQKIKTWVQDAGDRALALQHSLTFELKSDYTPVTNLDRQIDRELSARLLETFPKSGMLSEESSGVHLERSAVWVLDPIDGTKMFINGMPTWAVSLGLVEDGQPTFGVVYLPATHDLYLGWNGRIFWNDFLLKPREINAFEDVNTFLVAPANAHRKYRIDYPNVRSFGSTVAHLLYVLRGAAVGALTRRIYLWDMAGMLTMLATFGMKVQYLDGREFSPAELIHGERTPDALIVASGQYIDQVRGCIQRT